MSTESLKYPDQPPSCLTTGACCEGCTFLPDCNYLVLGEERVSTAGLLAAYDEALYQERKENRASRYDSVLPEFFTGSGIRREIRSNQELAEELSEGGWGLIYCDLRGLKSLNDNYSKIQGDELLRLAGRRLLLEAGIRHKQVPVKDNLRLSLIAHDIGIRDAGSDELAALIRGVTLDELLTVTIRQSERFSAQSAIRDYQAGQVPTILSFSYVHASELDIFLSADPIKGLDRAFETADDRHHAAKARQYEELWSLALMAAQSASQSLERPADERGIITHFMEHCCPDYHANADEWLSREHLARPQPVE